MRPRPSAGLIVGRAGRRRLARALDELEAGITRRSSAPAGEKASSKD
jgi:hypothetical protein